MSPPERSGSAGSLAPPVVVAGTLGDPTDSEPLEVTFRVEGDTVRLTTGDTELGAWPRDDVRMTPSEDDGWWFEAEGDRLPFRPARPAVLEASGLVPPPPAPARRRGRVRKRSKAGVATPVVADIGSPPVPRRRRVRLRVPSVRLPRRSNRSKPAREVGPRPSLWLRTVDVARHRGLFGLDRLPVDEGNRDGEHEHTWDHRAAGSGLAQHLCTICGAVRR